MLTDMRMLVTFVMSLYLLLSSFFFPGRSRHTRLQGDWISDVCSSDLFNGGRYPDDGDLVNTYHAAERLADRPVPPTLAEIQAASPLRAGRTKVCLSLLAGAGHVRSGEGRGGEEGRIWGVPDYLKKKKIKAMISFADWRIVSLSIHNEKEPMRLRKYRQSVSTAFLPPQPMTSHETRRGFLRCFFYHS